MAADLEAAGCSSLFARLLATRGVTPETLGAYLEPSLSALASPCALPGIAEAVEEILATAARRERIVVFGDYDCDGVCATAILLHVIRILSHPEAQPVAFLPDRRSEGYGMGPASVARLLEETPDVRLIVTVDNGINAVDQISALGARGIRVLVTDHHLPGDELPAAVVCVNPKVAAPAYWRELCGAGVAFLLANALMTAAKERGLYTGPSVGGPLLVLAGLATVTDIMPLTGQNRILVACALKNFAHYAPLGLRELLWAARRQTKVSSVKDFGFLIGPRINAAGRMASGMAALDLVLATQRDAAQELASRVDQCNTQRKAVEQDMVKAALSQVVPGAPAHVIELDDGHEGVAGIVAARVMEYAGTLPASPGGVPVAVLVGSHGSARAPAGYHVRNAFVAAQAALLRYGGHAAAGGFSVKPGEVARFRALFTAACAEQAVARAPEARCPAVFDGWVAPEALTVAFVDQIRKMEPFGEGNPEPVFGLRDVHLSDVRPLGAEGRHLALTFRERSVPKAVWWNHGGQIESLRAQAAAGCDILFTVELSDYHERHVELRLVDLAPRTSAAVAQEQGG